MCVCVYVGTEVLLGSKDDKLLIYTYVLHNKHSNVLPCLCIQRHSNCDLYSEIKIRNQLPKRNSHFCLSRSRQYLFIEQKNVIFTNQLYKLYNRSKSVPSCQNCPIGKILLLFPVYKRNAFADIRSKTRGRSVVPYSSPFAPPPFNYALPPFP